MSILLNILLIFMFILPSKAMASFFQKDEKCQRLEWANGDIRSQGGGWIWYMASSINSDIKGAYTEAENIALYRLSQECQGIPLESKFIERCDQVSGDQFEAFVRVNVTKNDCDNFKRNSNSIANKVLTDQLNVFLGKNSSSNDSAFVRSDEDTTKTNGSQNQWSSFVNFYNLGNYKKSYPLVKDFCVKDQDSEKCFWAGENAKKINKYSEALKYYEISCLSNNVRACDNYLKTKLKITKDYNSFINQFKDKTIRIADLACNLKSNIACLALSDYYFFNSMIEKSNDLLFKSCNSKGNYQNVSCKTLATRFYQNNDLSNLKKIVNQFEDKNSKEYHSSKALIHIMLNEDSDSIKEWKHACALNDCRSCFLIEDKNVLSVCNKEFEKEKSEISKFVIFQEGFKNSKLNFSYAKYLENNASLILDLEKSCMAGEFISCHPLLYYYEVNGKKNKVKSIAAIGCNFNDYISCEYLSGEEKDKSKVNEINQKGCKLGSSMLCAMIDFEKNIELVEKMSPFDLEKINNDVCKMNNEVCLMLSLTSSATLSKKDKDTSVRLDQIFQKSYKNIYLKCMSNEYENYSSCQYLHEFAKTFFKSDLKTLNKLRSRMCQLGNKKLCK